MARSTEGCHPTASCTADSNVSTACCVALRSATSWASTDAGITAATLMESATPLVIVKRIAGLNFATRLSSILLVLGRKGVPGLRPALPNFDLRITNLDLALQIVVQCDQIRVVLQIVTFRTGLRNDRGVFALRHTQSIQIDIAVILFECEIDVATAVIVRRFRNLHQHGEGHERLGHDARTGGLDCDRERSLVYRAGRMDQLIGDGIDLGPRGV